MLYTAITTAFLMGLAGGFHCLAMCLVPCHALIGLQSNRPAHAHIADINTAEMGGGIKEAQVSFHPRQNELFQKNAARWLWRALGFHAGRLAGYAFAGAVVAWAMGNFALLSQSSALLQPLWSGAHALILIWGFAMLLMAQQPPWFEPIGRRLWRYIEPLAARRYGVVVTSFAWVFLPCGLLYSALLLAALTQGFWQGAASMAAFGVGTGLWLVLGSGVWKGVSYAIRQKVHAQWLPWGTRLAGLLLMVSAGFALWMEWFVKPGLWCVSG